MPMEIRTTFQASLLHEIREQVIGGYLVGKSLLRLFFCSTISHFDYSLRHRNHYTRHIAVFPK